MLTAVILIGVAVITACAVNIKPAKAAGEPTATPTILGGAVAEYTGTAQKIVTDLPSGMKYIIRTDKIDTTNIDAGKIVPTGYTALDYLQSTGTQYIDTGVLASGDTRVVIDWQFNDITNAQQRIFGNMTGSDSFNFEIYLNSHFGISYCYNDDNGNWVNTQVAADTERHVFDLNGLAKTLQIDNGKTFNSGLSYNTVNNFSDTTIAIFFNRIMNSSDCVAHANAYSCQMYEKGVLQRDFVPVRADDGTLGMYDLCTGELYKNQGDGDDFVAGDEVNTAIKDWEWLDSVDDEQNNVTLQANTKYYVYYYTPNTDTTTVTPLAVKEFYVNCTNHVYGEWTITTPATCTTDGVREHTCTGCGHAESETITALGHDYQGVPVAPTCGAQGYTVYTCTRCPEQYQDDFVAATGEHSWGEWTTTDEPTCTDGGTQQHTCNACGLTESEHTSATGHNYGTQIIDPTCTAAGYTEHACQNPGCTASYRDEPTAALGHEYGDTVHQPTCTESGYTTHQCQRCEHSYNDTYTAATGHKYGTWTTTEPATTDHPGEQQRTCEVCGAMQTRTLPALAGTTTNGGEKDNSGPLLWGIIIGAIAVLAGCGGLAWLLIVLFKPKHPKAEVAAA